MDRWTWLDRDQLWHLLDKRQQGQPPMTACGKPARLVAVLPPLPPGPACPVCHKPRT